MKKVCTKCQKELPMTVEFFSRDRRLKSGLRSTCKACIKKWRVEYLSKPEVKERRREYYIENREQIVKNKKQYRNRIKAQKMKVETEKLHEQYWEAYSRWKAAHKEYIHFLVSTAKPVQSTESSKGE
tara:strand:+ start:43 stop:423 length:381 start_codon:yes stop_codon:yes gene_type:complete